MEGDYTVCQLAGGSWVVYYPTNQGIRLHDKLYLSKLDAFNAIPTIERNLQDISRNSVNVTVVNLLDSMSMEENKRIFWNAKL